ncbi:MAG: hypothetical protein NWE92_06955 [Candidatus Bathyarchaeota archaeon]|nr:hypothetical protein [Candidatus Bathyarchaeota archaeon]
MAKTCWECKHNSIKIMFLVPPHRTIKEYVHCTGGFCLDLATEAPNQGEHDVWLRVNDALEQVKFKTIHTCKINQDQNVASCKSHEKKPEQNPITNVIYRRILPAEVTPKIPRHRIQKSRVVG